MWAGFCPNLTIIYDLAADASSLRRRRPRPDHIGNGRKSMKLHGTRPGSSLGMLLEHVKGVLAQFDNIFRGLVAVDVYMLFSTADQISFGNGLKWMKLHGTDSE